MSDPSLPPVPSIPPPPPPPPPPQPTVPPPPPPPSPYGSAPGYGAPPPPPSGGYTYNNPPAALAGFWIRFGGALLDGLLYGLAALPFLIPAFFMILASVDDCYTVTRRNGSEELYCPEGALNVGLLVVGIVIGIAGLLLILILQLRGVAKSGQTWGRKIVGVRVVRDADGQAPGWGRAVGRFFFTYISGNCCYLGYLWMLWDPKKQTWHDKVAGTRVIRV